MAGIAKLRQQQPGTDTSSATDLNSTAGRNALQRLFDQAQSSSPAAPSRTVRDASTFTHEGQRFAINLFHPDLVEVKLVGAIENGQADVVLKWASHTVDASILGPLNTDQRKRVLETRFSQIDVFALAA